MDQDKKFRLCKLKSWRAEKSRKIKYTITYSLMMNEIA